jgi:hypothetical protein
MLCQRFLEDLAVAVIVFDCANLGDATEALEGAQVGFVYMGEVGIGDDNVGQSLDVAQPMGKPGQSETKGGR